MKKSTVIASALAIVAIAGALTFNATQASATTEEEAKAAASIYVDSLNKGDFETAVKYVEDARFKDQAETLAAYKEMAVNNPTSDFKIVSLEASNGKKATVTLKSYTEDAGAVQATFPMEKDKDGWKVVIDEVKSVKAKDKK